ncbi:MAG: dephospho-CoA kinase [Prevotella sp.]|nr:dephospho-CoA kinase [Prevotella sp.]
MKHIAITGGIGSGKSFVCQLLKKRGIRVYDCDEAAKRLMRSSETLKSALRQLVGKKVYTADGRLQKRVLAAFLLTSEANKQAVNNIVHPAVAQDFLSSGLSWLESAILFDSGFDARLKFDHVVCVTAPLELRVSRVMQRDGITREKALEWIHCQMPQEEVLRRSDFEIINDGAAELEAQIDEMLEAIES